MMHAEDTQAFEHQVQANYASLFAGDADAEQWLTGLYEVVGTPPDMQVASAR